MLRHRSKTQKLLTGKEASAPWRLSSSTKDWRGSSCSTDVPDEAEAERPDTRRLKTVSICSFAQEEDSLCEFHRGL